MSMRRIYEKIEREGLRDLVYKELFDMIVNSRFCLALGSMWKSY